MKKLIARIFDFINRSKWLGEIVGSPYRAGYHWILRRVSPKTLATGKYGAYSFTFRGMDVPIIREIIHEKEYDFLKKDLACIKEPIILDVGAHIGLFALTILNIVPSAKIFSIEAGPETFSFLQKNAKDAQKTHPVKWQVLNRAAWRDDAPVRFDENVISMGQGVRENATLEVQGISLAQALQITGTHRINLMKVDIEGAEEAFLCSHPEQLEKVERLVLELHKEHCNTENIEALLKKNYTSINYLKNRYSSRPVLYCRR